MAIGRPTKALNVTPEEKEKLTVLARRPVTVESLRFVKPAFARLC